MGANGYGVWSSPIADADVAQFMADATLKLGAGRVVEYRTLKWDFLLAAADIGNVNQPAIYSVIELASAKETAAGPTDNTAPTTLGWPGSETTRPLEPKLNAQGLVPVGTSILMCGLGVVVSTPLVVAPGFLADPSDPAASFAAAAAADDALAGIHAAFDASIIQIRDARTQKGLVCGHEAVSFGASRVAAYGPPIETADGVVEQLLYSGQVTYKDRGWARISPVYFDGGAAGLSASQIVVEMAVPRSTNWPLRASTRMRVSVMAPSLVAYQGSAGPIACDPPAATPPAGLPPPYGKIIQQPGKRW